MTDLVRSSASPPRCSPTPSACCSRPPASTRPQLSRVLATIHAHDVDFADLYFQHSRFESWSLEEGIVKSGTFNIDRGVGVRAVVGDKQAFAYSDDISLAALDEAAHRGARDRPPGTVGRRAARPARRRARALFARRSGREPRAKPTRSRCSSGSSGWRARAIRASTQVMASLAGEHETVLIARSDGLVAADVRPLVRVSLTVIVEENGRREQGYAGGGGRFDYAYFTDAMLDEYATRGGRPGAAQPGGARRARGQR